MTAKASDGSWGGTGCAGRNSRSRRASASGATFYQFHLLYDKHASEQAELADAVAERVLQLGDLNIAMAADVAELTLIHRPPRGREAVPAQFSRLLQAHEVVFQEARTMARQAARSGDDGTSDLLVSGVIRTNETQVWLLAAHLADGSLVHTEGGVSP